MRIPEFRAEVYARWEEFAYDEILASIAHIQNTARTYQAAFERNFERHEIMGVYVWPNPDHVYEIDTFLGQVDFLVDYLTRRANYMNDLFSGN